MNDALKTQISAFVDGELPDNELEMLLRRMSQDAALRAQVNEYMAIGRLMRQDVEVPGMECLRDRIAASLGDDAAPAVEAQRVVGSRFMTPATGVAVAATVAALALVGLSQFDPMLDSDLDGAVAIDMAPATKPAMPAMSNSSRATWAAATPTIRLAVETMPSLAPMTAARSQPIFSAKCFSACRCIRLPLAGPGAGYFR